MAVAKRLDDGTSSAPRRKSGGGKDQSQKTGSLYADHKKIYPKKVTGRFRSIKTWTNVALLGVYFITPWLRWDRGPDVSDQMILMDMAGRRAYFFNVEIWPQEIYYLTGLLIAGAIGLFFATALLGRVWCGFTCIQTVFTDLFLVVEKWLEGDRNARIKLDRAPMTARAFARKALKIFIWALISLATGYGWMIYFNDAPTLTVDLAAGEASVGVYAFLFLVAGVTFVLAGWAREQVCIYMCPWPRFQASMFDEDSLIVTYEKWRGEPRGFAKKGAAFENRGHCVDCTLCVQVCPTGVDIREGNQLACIGCGLCIDACNDIMDRFDLPRGLITYDSVNRQVARAKGGSSRRRLVRPRTVGYAALLSVVVGVMAWSLATRDRLEVNILHERSPLFVTLSDGSIRNGYTLKVLNMLAQDHAFELEMKGLDGATMSIVGDKAAKNATKAILLVKADSVGVFRLYVTARPQALDGKAGEVTLSVRNVETGEVSENETLFAGPRR